MERYYDSDFEPGQGGKTDLGSSDKVGAALSRIARDCLAANAERVDRESRWPEEGIRTLQSSGLGGLVLSRRHGGLDQGLHGLAKACETLGRECASTAICFGMHCVGSAVLAAQATDYQAENYLRPIADGRHLTTLALSEPGTGIHFYYPQSRLTHREGGDLEIDGRKSFVTNGTHADSYVVSVMHPDDRGMEHFSCVIVDDDLEGMTWGDGWSGFGMRGNDSRNLTLDHVRVPMENLLGSKGDQTWYVFNVVAPYFLTAMSGVYLGVATSALELARVHLKSREHSHAGTRLEESSVLQQRLGQLWSKLEAVRQLVRSAARRFDEGDETAALAVMASKAEVAEIATMVVNETMTLMGGIAYRDGERIQRLLRDVRAAHVMAPTTELLRIWIGRMLLDRPILGD